MSAEDEDLQSYWDDIRAPRPIRLMGPRVSNSLELACQKTYGSIVDEVAKIGSTRIDGPLLGRLISNGIRTFLENWRESLAKEDLSGLVEIVLEDTRLTPTELTEFVRALPESLLTRITESAIGSTTGIHGLMAVEYGRRQGRVTQYTLTKQDDRLKVEFWDRNIPMSIEFFLDEEFRPEVKNA